MWMRICSPQTATIEKLCDALRQTRCTEALEALSRAGMSYYCYRIVIYNDKLF